ncbi:hypothetical protein [Xanthocytophaga agilis]|uniref:Uncharacterized protein n=1 Tax=Xanthocytophaga agilis TaxID=3048010 RepID=A0AAE3QZZ5_9BACT|nr:hypothetical protein [Xanthocytophaga agilis]MDJ1501156.1 hypothetical protein [Xanthocytophaga agilis]
MSFYQLILQFHHRSGIISNFHFSTSVRLICLGLFCALLFFPTTHAQTGPGGVGNTSTNALWLDATKLSILTNGAKLSQWSDFSGNNRHALQSNGANQPTYLTNALNGRPVIHFDRSNAYQYLQISGNNIGTVMSNSNTIFAVAKANSGGINNNANNIGNYQSIFTAVGSHSGIEVYGYPNATNIFCTNWLGGNMNLNPAPVTAYGFSYSINQGDWFLATVRNEETSTNTIGGAFFNGTPGGTNTSTYPLTDYTNQLVRIGAANASGDYAWPLNGDIAEIIAFSQALTPTQRIIVENYLAAKYNLTIPATSDFYNAPDVSYNYDVQGIGTIDGSEKNPIARNGKGLTLSELDNTLNTSNEFVLAGHNSTTNTLVHTNTSIPIADRWDRNWYIQANGSVNVKIGFDFSDGEITAPGNLAAITSEFRLLYRANPNSPFEVVNSSNQPLVPVLENGDELTFVYPNLPTGYYTLGKVTGSLDFTGPGGVGSSLTNALWLDASKLPVTSNGSVISSFTDRSGNNRHALQSSTNNKPTYQSNSLNSRPVIHFDRSNAYQYLEISGNNIGTLMSNSNTIFTIARTNSGALNNTTNTAQSIFIAIGYHSGIWLYGYPTALNATMSSWVNGNYPGVPTDGTTTAGSISQGSWLMATMQNIETSNSTTTKGFINGNPLASSTKGFLMANYTNQLVRIGAANASGDYAWPLNGDIAEIIAFSQALTPTQRIIVENYLAAKYNLTIPATSDFYNAPDVSYNYDVQGIGTIDGADRHKRASSGSGLILSELAEVNGSLNASNEFLFSGHNITTNSIITTDLPIEISNRWQRSWYLQKNGEINATLSFDFIQAGLSIPANLSTSSANYRLLYRSATTGNFTVVTNSQGAALIPTLDASNRLVFSIQNGNQAGKSLVSGYYTIGLGGPTYVWKSNAVTNQWNDTQNWEQSNIPTTAGTVIVNTCTVCPQLPSSLTVSTFALTEGSGIDLNGYTLTATNNILINKSTVRSTGTQSSGTIKAVNITDVAGSTFIDPITFEKTGGETNNWSGGNVFKKKVNIINNASPASTINMATQTDDTVQQ